MKNEHFQTLAKLYCCAEFKIKVQTYNSENKAFFLFKETLFFLILFKEMLLFYFFYYAKGTHAR